MRLALTVVLDFLTGDPGRPPLVDLEAILLFLIGNRDLFLIITNKFNFSR